MRRRTSFRGRGLGAGILFSAALLVRPAAAHDVLPPKPKTQTAAQWPGGHAEKHDVLVPVSLTIGADGIVQLVTVEATVSHDFDEAAVTAAQSWTFEPAVRDGVPVASRIRAVVRFIGEIHADEHMHADTHADGSQQPAATTSGVAPKEDEKEKQQTAVVHGVAPPRSASEAVRGRDVIGAAPHRTASDVLAVAPGVFISQHSGEGKANQIFLRGFDAQHGQDIEIWVGGLPINEVSNIHGQGYADVHFVMPEIVKEVRSTPGTFDPRQGDFAVAGSIRLRLGYNEPGLTARGTLGSFGTRRMFIAYHPKDASDETFAAFEEYATDGFGPNRAARRGSLVAQVSHDFGDGLALRALATTYSARFDSAGVVRANDVELGKIDRFGFYDPRQGGYSARTQLLTELHKDEEGARWSFAPFVAFRSLTIRQNYTGYLQDSQVGGASQLRSDNTQQVHGDVMVGATASYRRKVEIFSSRDAIEAGFYGRNDWIDQSQRRLSDVDDTPTQTSVDATIRGTNIAGYLDAAIHPIAPLAIRGGVRVDTLSYSTEDHLVAAGGGTGSQSRAAQGAHVGKKLTVDYAIVPKVHALASYGEGFRSPQARALYEGEKTPFTEVTSYELGVRYNEAAWFQSSVAAFYTSLSEDLAFDERTARNESVPATHRMGTTAELTARAGTWLTVSSNLTYTRATFAGSNDRYHQGDLLPFVPQWVARTDAMATTKLGHLWNRELTGRIGVGTEAIVRRPLPYSEFGRNVFLIDATCGLRLKEVELGLDVYNLLNAHWYDGEFVYPSNFDRTRSAQLVPLHHVTVGAPRSVFASLSLYL